MNWRTHVCMPTHEGTYKPCSYDVDMFSTVCMDNRKFHVYIINNNDIVGARNWSRTAVPAMDVLLWQVFGISDFFANKICLWTILDLKDIVLWCCYTNNILLCKANKRSIYLSITYVRTYDAPTITCQTRTRDSMALLRRIHVSASLDSSQLYGETKMGAAGEAKNLFSTPSPSRRLYNCVMNSANCFSWRCQRWRRKRLEPLSLRGT